MQQPLSPTQPSAPRRQALNLADPLLHQQSQQVRWLNGRASDYDTIPQDHGDEIRRFQVRPLGGSK
ncbi:hypothetical protein BT67DRAFT_442261 [Trichocladium antarcticum]|uniref:Uncharacterized protein n=1 Tax=Trichocladium antarcticum TaxID=1450529 RepID=A0AAN6UKB8_9PEZI|nr:hypothetical protein BT67DRAFT_442261 [Trichocladium antarcticum]